MSVCLLPLLLKLINQQIISFISLNIKNVESSINALYHIACDCCISFRVRDITSPGVSMRDITQSNIECSHVVLAGALKIIPSRDGAQSNSCSLLDGERLMQLGFSSSLTLHTSHILSPISQDVSMVCPLYTKLNHVTFFLPIEHVNLTGNVVIISVCSNQFTICLFAICL